MCRGRPMRPPLCCGVAATTCSSATVSRTRRWSKGWASCAARTSTCHIVYRQLPPVVAIVDRHCGHRSTRLPMTIVDQLIAFCALRDFRRRIHADTVLHRVRGDDSGRGLVFPDVIRRCAAIIRRLSGRCFSWFVAVLVWLVRSDSALFARQSTERSPGVRLIEGKDQKVSGAASGLSSYSAEIFPRLTFEYLIASLQMHEAITRGSAGIGCDGPTITPAKLWHGHRMHLAVLLTNVGRSSTPCRVDFMGKGQWPLDAESGCLPAARARVMSPVRRIWNISRSRQKASFGGAACAEVRIVPAGHWAPAAAPQTSNIVHAAVSPDAGTTQAHDRERAWVVDELSIEAYAALQPAIPGQADTHFDDDSPWRGSHRFFLTASPRARRDCGTGPSSRGRDSSACPGFGSASNEQSGYDERRCVSLGFSPTGSRD